MLNIDAEVNCDDTGENLLSPYLEMEDGTTDHCAVRTDLDPSDCYFSNGNANGSHARKSNGHLTNGSNGTGLTNGTSVGNGSALTSSSMRLNGRHYDVVTNHTPL